jgi:hypothetical protein
MSQGVVSDYLKSLIAKQVADRGPLVWYVGLSGPNEMHSLAGASGSSLHPGVATIFGKRLTNIAMVRSVRKLGSTAKKPRTPKDRAGIAEDPFPVFLVIAFLAPWRFNPLLFLVIGFSAPLAFLAPLAVQFFCFFVLRSRRPWRFNFSVFFR